MTSLGPRDALLIVDVQPDFCPGGKLGVPGGDEVIPVLNRWIEQAVQGGATVVASRDWHPGQHPSFHARKGPWPPHCIQDTPGAAFHPDLALPEDTLKVSKGVRLDRDQYSLFDDTGLAEYLREQGVRGLWVGGLAQDVCVRASVLDGCQHGFDVHVITDATRPVQTEAGQRALLAMRAAGARLE